MTSQRNDSTNSEHVFIFFTTKCCKNETLSVIMSVWMKQQKNWFFYGYSSMQILLKLDRDDRHWTRHTVFFNRCLKHELHKYYHRKMHCVEVENETHILCPLSPCFEIIEQKRRECTRSISCSYISTTYIQQSTVLFQTQAKTVKTSCCQ